MRFPPQPDVSVLITDSANTFWSKEEVVVPVDNDEVWTINKAMLDDSFWHDQAVKNLGEKLETVEIGKRKAKDILVAFWSEDFDTEQKLEDIKIGKLKINEFSNF